MTNMPSEVFVYVRFLEDNESIVDFFYLLVDTWDLGLWFVSSERQLIVEVEEQGMKPIAYLSHGIILAL